MDNAQLSALISLLDDPDENVFHQIREKLLSMGNVAVPALESAWENSFDPLLQSRIENIIHSIQLDYTRNSLRTWALPGQQDLLEGALIVARTQYPDLDEERIRRHIEQIKQDIWLELNNNLTALEKVRVINHILFDVHNFSGNTANYHAPQNSYINNVLETKKGNPLSLSIIYAVIAQDLRIPVYGVNLPEHFILAYVDAGTDQPMAFTQDSDRVLFYINPFSRGWVVSRKEIDAYLKQQNLDPKAEYYAPCSNLDIIRSLITKLIISYERLGYPNKTEELKRMMDVLSDF
jgi:regulator of sirC expression with transglutaminase-like and TPR domain